MVCDTGLATSVVLLADFQSDRSWLQPERDFQSLITPPALAGGGLTGNSISSDLHNFCYVATSCDMLERQ